jgi:hypothetical protein
LPSLSVTVAERLAGFLFDRPGRFLQAAFDPLPIHRLLPLICVKNANGRSGTTFRMMNNAGFDEARLRRFTPANPQLTGPTDGGLPFGARLQ